MTTPGSLELTLTAVATKGWAVSLTWKLEGSFTDNEEFEDPTWIPSASSSPDGRTPQYNQVLKRFTSP